MEIAEKKWLITAIFFYFLSSSVVWFIPIVIVKTGKTDLYYNLIYFYLHFLYNGFFTFALWGLIFLHVREYYEIPTLKSFNLFFLIMQIAVIPTYVLSLYWNPISLNIQVLGIASAALQLFAIVYLILSFYRQTALFEKGFTFLLILGIFGDKIFLQFLSSFYALSVKAIALKPYFMVGYLHWFTIGFLTFSLLWLSGITKSNVGKKGFLLLVIGFFVTEIILFYKGTAVLMGWNENLLPYSGIFYGSLMMFLGILLLLHNKIIPPQYTTP